MFLVYTACMAYRSMLQGGSSVVRVTYSTRFLGTKGAVRGSRLGHFLEVARSHSGE